MAKVSLAVTVLALAAITVTAYKSQSADTSSGTTATVERSSAMPDRNPRPVGEDAAERAQPTASATKDEIATAVRGVNEFSFDFYARVKKGKGNIFISPYSISTALAMTYGGARGNTGAEMEKTLHFTLTQRQHAAFGALIKDLNATEKNGKPRGYQLSVANRLFGSKGYEFLQPFLDLNKFEYGAELERLDFTPPDPAEASRQRINGWVEEKTQKKITDLIPKSAVDGASLVLTNAIYFKGDWAEQFDKTATSNAVFHLTADKDVQAPLMRKTTDVKYMEKEGSFQAIELPYKNNELSMVVILPEKVDGLTDVENSLSADNLKAWLASMSQQDTAISLPKFKMTWGTENIAGTLQTMGIKDAFRTSANFSGMTDHPEGLFIGAVFHKAFVDVNEEGTEAAAATAVVMGPGRPPHKPKVFTADRPFLFLIKENAGGAILFMGRVVDPR